MVFVSDSSGRFATSYIPECVMNEKIKNSVGIKDNYAYRMYLQRNGAELAQNNDVEAKKQSIIDLGSNCDCAKCILISKKEYFKTLLKQ